MDIRAIAISAPDWIYGKKGKETLNSRDPASLFNACRQAALLSENPDSAWANSNWAPRSYATETENRNSRRGKLMLMYSLEDMADFDQLIQREQPNILFIGAMTLCFPGAIACALRARELLGDRVKIVLGGRHPSETVFLDSQHKIKHHAGSPLQLMERGVIPQCFDLVVSGDGEHVIAAAGEAIARGLDLKEYFYTNLPQVGGRWIVGGIDPLGKIWTLQSFGQAIDYHKMPTPQRMFGVNTSFDVFGGRMTAHLFSDTGRGCVYNCNFCSERRDATGGAIDLQSSNSRLYRQMADSVHVIEMDHPGKRASGFVEDSVLLGGSISVINKLAEQLEHNPLDIKWGAQLTIDQILQRKELLKRLNKVGLSYLFIGLETFDPQEIGGMSKNVGVKREPWIERAEQVFETLCDIGIDCGAAILFGLGESHQNRINLLHKISEWQQRFKMPFPVSLNWAVQHPLLGEDAGSNYDYVQWGTPKGEFLDSFQDFGEASLLYPLAGVNPPQLNEVQEVRSILATYNYDYRLAA